MRKQHLWLLLSSLVLLLSSNPLLAATIQLKVRTAVANIRLMPDLASGVVGQVRAGSILESEERLGDWFKVTLPASKERAKITGYINISTVDVQIQTPPIAPAKPPRASVPLPASALPSASAPGPRLGIRITGGLAYLAAGDANAARTSSTANWRDRALQPGSGMTVEGEAPAIHWGADFGADVLYILNPRLRIGLGVGGILARKSGDQSRMEITYPSASKTIARENSFSAIPVRLGVFYDLVQVGRFSLAVNAGLGLYFARWKELEDYKAESSGTLFDGKYETNVHAARLGFHGGLSLEYRLSPGFSLVLEGFGRYARFSGFEGFWRQTNAGGFDVTYQGKLYYYEWEENGKTYPWIEHFEKDPKETNVSTPIKNSRLAVIDFSGFSLRAGIKVSF